jgi:heavy metal efflux system protein
MINRIIDFSISNKFIIGLMTFALIAWGIYSITRLPIDAVPDITNNQVQVISIAPTLATQEIEKNITAPIEMAVATVPEVIELRSISRLGLSVITIVFNDNVDIYKARQQISERLKEAETQIPPGVTHPELAPVSTGLGEIYQYLLRVKDGYQGRYSETDLRTIQDWIVKRELLGTPGVAEVNSYGGFVKEYEVAVNPEQLRSMNVTVPEIFEALENNNENTGSAYIEKTNNLYFIRGIGLVQTIEDIGKIVIKVNPGKLPVLIRDVAQVQPGHAIRYGAFVCDTTEAVGGVVMMLKGSNSSKVIKAVKERMKTIEHSLPEGVYIESYLDRTDLVNRAIGTVSRNLVEGGLIVVLVLVLFLGSLRAGLVVASVIPLAMLFAISMMNVFGISGNLMSLGAIDFGLIVDGAVIIVENVVHRISRESGKRHGVLKLTSAQMDHEVLGSAKRMMNSATFGQIIILIVYLPILTLVGIEGKMFRPMAETVGFAILGALLLSLTYVPVVSSLFLSKKTVNPLNIADRIMGLLHRLFDPMISFSLQHKISVLIVSVVLFISSIFVFTRLGGEFIPNLEEGDLASGIMTLQGGSLTHTVETVKKANRILLENFPEVKHAICKVGAGEIPTDPTPVETGDYIITMKDKKEWTSASNREEMVEKMKEKVSALAGVDFSFQQPIQMRFNELMTGSKQDVAVKIFGDNLDSLAGEAEHVAMLITAISGVEDVQVDKVTGSPQISVVYNRSKLAQYGLNISDVNKILRTAFAGSAAGIVFEEEKRFDLVVRFSEEYRKDIDHVRHLYVPLTDGRQIPLEEIADISLKTGTAQVSREDAKRRITIGFNVRNRDVQSIIDECRDSISMNIRLPAGYFITFGGQFENLVEAQNRLMVAVPVALILIFVLLFLTFRSVKESLLIFSAVPLSAIGGIFALYIRDMNFSISAGVGFIALFGVAVLNGIVLIAEFNRLEKEEGITDPYERVRRGLQIRLRPVIMTAAVASLGFLPMALSTTAGAEVQKPLATVVIGGLLSSTLLTIIILPILYILYLGKRKIVPSIKPASLVILIFVAGGFLLFPSNNASAQTAGGTRYSLSRAIERALTANGEVNASVLDIKSQKALRQTAWDFDKTQVGFSYGQMNSFEKDNEFTVSQNFEFPVTYINKDHYSRESIKKAEIKASLVRTEITGLVKAAYFELSFSYTRLRLLLSQDSVYGNFLKAATERYKTGESNLLEKITAESQQASVNNQIRQAYSDIAIAKSKLKTLLNETLDISIEDSILPRLSIVLPDDSSFLESNPMLAYLEQQVKLSRLEHKVEASRVLPDIMVGYFDQSNKELSSSGRFNGVQAGLSIPILFSGQKGRIESAKINEKISESNYSYMKNATREMLSILVNEYNKYSQGLEYYESTALRQAEMIISQSTKSYRAGEIDYMEYVQNLKQGFEIRNNYLETLNAYNHSIITIEQLINKFN